MVIPFVFINSAKDSFDKGKKDPLIPTSIFEERKKVASNIFFPNETKMRFLVLLRNWKRLLTIKQKLSIFGKQERLYLSVERPRYS